MVSLVSILFEYRYVFLAFLIGAVVLVFLNIGNILSYPTFSLSYSRMESLPNYGDRGLKLSEVEGNYCDVFFSGPSREIKYYNNITCSDLDETYITKQNLLDFFENEYGMYSIIVFSDADKGYTINFEVRD